MTNPYRRLRRRGLWLVPLISLLTWALSSVGLNLSGAGSSAAEGGFSVDERPAVVLNPSSDAGSAAAVNSSRAVGSSTFSDTFGWRPEQVHSISLGGARAVRADGCVLVPEDGGYLLPVMPVSYKVDPGRRVVSVRVLSEEWQPMGSGYSVDDWNRAGGLWDPGERGRAFFAAPAVRSSAEWYPSSAVEYIGGGYLRGRRMEGFVIRPVRYRGQGGRLEYLSRLEIEVELEDGGPGGLKVSRAVRGVEGGVDGMLGAVTRRVIGEGHGEWMERQGVQVEDEVGVEGGFMPSLLPDVEGSAVEYVIVTNEEMSGEFERLAGWKRSKGVGAVVKTVDWIESNYPNGVDLAETIRFFLQDAYENWGTLWVLLGGDTDVIPIRYAYGARYDEFVPTDVYYSCLDGDWNGDGDELWGEGMVGLDAGDMADLYPEVFVGRAPVNTPDQAAVFVNKVIGYEKNPPIGYQNKALMFAEVLFPSNWDGRREPYLDGAALAETAIDALPEDFQVSRFYENYADPDYAGASPLGRDVIVDELNEGYGLAHHVGHGFRTTMSVGSGTLHNPDITRLTNGRKISVVTALNCDAAAVDYNCIGEAFLLNPDGGGVAYLGATRFEFPTTAWGYQDELYKMLFRHGVSRIGQALSWARLLFVPASRRDNVDRWSQLVHILLGDPELTVWTAVPSTLDVSLPEAMEAGLGTLSANVSSGGAPVEGAVVTCSKEGEVYSIGRTDASGAAALAVSPDTPGALAVTVTAANHIPFEAEVPVSAAGDAQVYVQSMSLADAEGGDGDGIPERGETFDILMTLVNGGTAASSQVAGVLTFENGSNLEVLEDSVSTPGLAAGASVVAAPFSVRVLPSATDGQRVSGRAVFSASEGGSSYDFSLYLGAPRLEIYETTVNDSAGGDGDGTAEPGESVSVKVLLSNAGRGSGSGVYALLEAAGGGPGGGPPRLRVLRIGGGHGRRGRRRVQSGDGSGPLSGLHSHVPRRGGASGTKGLRSCPAGRAGLSWRIRGRGVHSARLGAGVRGRS